MVEMTETANILHNATRESLVLMDEIGRGTSTFDGLSLAWAVAHYIGEQVGAFTLFATHYFELTSLADEIEATVNVHLDATEYKNRLVFMHSVKEGPANQSYGLQVAALAGVPDNVITSARTYLRALEARAPRRAPIRCFSSSTSITCIRRRSAASERWSRCTSSCAIANNRAIT